MQSSIPRHWRLKQQRYRMMGQICSRCQQPTFPPRPVCPNCVEAEQVVPPINLVAILPETQAQYAIEVPRPKLTNSLAD